MKIIDTFLTKSFTIKSRDIYVTAVEIINILSQYGKLVERKNIYGSDGPRKSLEMLYVIIKPIDRQSRMKMSFIFSGESNGSSLIEMNIMCEFQMKVRKRGLASETFADFYAQNIMPFFRKRAEEDATKIVEDIGKQIKKNFVISR